MQRKFAKCVYNINSLTSRLRKQELRSKFLLLIHKTSNMFIKQGKEVEGIGVLH